MVKRNSDGCTNLRSVAEEGRIFLVQCYGLVIKLDSVQPFVAPKGLVAFLLKGDGIFACRHCKVLDSCEGYCNVILT